MNLSSKINTVSKLSETPLVSTIVPVFNRTGLAIRAIKSIISQTYPNIEIVVVNDGSTESIQELLDFIKDIDHVVYVELDRNSGPAAARNAGILAAKGDFLAFLDSDDVWPEEKLSVQLEIMLRKGWEFSHASYWRFDTRSGESKLVRSGFVDYAFPFAAFHCGIATPTVVVEREALSKFRFMESLRVGEDNLLWLELSKLFVLHGINKPLATVYVGMQTTTFNAALRIKALLHIGQQGLAGHQILLAIHAIYRFAKRMQFILIGLYRNWR